MSVVVDFASLGGGAQTRCAPGDPATGIDALRGAGFTPTRAAQQPGYFVCRIDGKPASDPCQRASPADAYWSYWHGTPGGSWTFANAGAADHDPAPGSVDGWAFGAGDPPSAPPPRRAQPSSPPPRSPSAAPLSPAAVASPTRAPSPRPSAPRSTAPTASPLTTPYAATSPAPTATPSAAPSATPDSAVDAAAEVPPNAVVPDENPGSPTGPLVAAGVLAVLAALGLAQARRRR